MQLPVPAPLQAPLRRKALPTEIVAALVVGSGLVLAGLAGWLAATGAWLLVAGAGGGAAFLAAALRRPTLALAGLLAVVVLLPFGVAPLRLGISPTLLDLATVLLFFVWLALAAAGRSTTRLTGPGAAVLAYGASLVAAFILSGDVLRPDENGRAFVKLVLATLLFLPVVNLVGRPGVVRQVTAWLLAVCALEAVVGLVLYFAPRSLAYRALVALGPLGYPTDATVLRYRPDTDILRATGTAVDPNMLGALLMVASAIAVPIVLAPRPALPRRPLILALAVILPCLLFTESRGSWLGLAGAIGVVAVLRHRRLLLAMILGLPLLLVLPAAARFTDHLISGLQAQDRASALRIGEIQNALAVIAHYPWFGAGWGDGARSIELTFTLGVSNIYLTVAERAGIPATLLFLVALAALAATLWPAVRRHRRDPAADGLLMGLVAALVATQIAGMLDHHFVRFPHLVTLLWTVAALAVAEALAPAGRRPGTRRTGAESALPALRRGRHR
jgi:O-antigen ligase